jgi:hypothetical protein
MDKKITLENEKIATKRLKNIKEQEMTTTSYLNYTFYLFIMHSCGDAGHQRTYRGHH